MGKSGPRRGNGAGGLARSLILSGQVGTHEFCVTDLVKEGYDYKPEENETPACKGIEVGR